MMMKSSIDAVIVLFILQLFSQLQTKNLEFEHFVYTLETLEKKKWKLSIISQTQMAWQQFKISVKISLILDYIH